MPPKQDVRTTHLAAALVVRHDASRVALREDASVEAVVAERRQHADARGGVQVVEAQRNAALRRGGDEGRHGRRRRTRGDAAVSARGRWHRGGAAAVDGREEPRPPLRLGVELAEAEATERIAVARDVRRAADVACKLCFAPQCAERCARCAVRIHLDSGADAEGARLAQVPGTAELGAVETHTAAAAVRSEAALALAAALAAAK